jgi:hypothetical protein
MAFVPYLLIQDVISPLLKMMNSVVVSASTNLDKNNHFSKFFTEEYRRKAKIDELVITMQTDLLCGECRKAGLAFECRHGAYKHPPFNNAANEHRAKVFIADSSKYAQEMLGSIVANDVNVISEDDIESLKRRRLSDLMEETDPSNVTVWHYIDPCGGSLERSRGRGPPSKLGFASMIRHQKRKIIVGLHSHQAISEEDHTEQTMHYFASMAQDPFLRKCRHILFVEMNYGGTLTADFYYQRARRALRNIQTVNWFSDRPGVRKTRENTNSAAMTLAVDLKQGNISFYRFLHSASDATRREALEDFIGQLGRLHKVIHPDGKHSYSAKTSNACDDVLVSYIMAGYFSYHFLVMQHFDQLDKGMRGMGTTFETGDSFY